MLGAHTKSLLKLFDASLKVGCGVDNMIHGDRLLLAGMRAPYRGNESRKLFRFSPSTLTRHSAATPVASIHSVDRSNPACTAIEAIQTAD